MKLIQILALSIVVLYLTQENKTNGFKIIKIPIYTINGIIWIAFKVPAKFAWSIIKLPTKLVIKLAWMLAKTPIKKITPEFLEYNIKKLLEEYEIEKKKRKKEKSKRHRMKEAIKKSISNTNHGIHSIKSKISRVNNKMSARIKKINWRKQNKRKNTYSAKRQQVQNITPNPNIH